MVLPVQAKFILETLKHHEKTTCCITWIDYLGDTPTTYNSTMTGVTSKTYWLQVECDRRKLSVNTAGSRTNKLPTKHESELRTTLSYNYIMTVVLT